MHARALRLGRCGGRLARGGAPRTRDRRVPAVLVERDRAPASDSEAGADAMSVAEAVASAGADPGATGGWAPLERSRPRVQASDEAGAPPPDPIRGAWPLPFHGPGGRRLVLALPAEAVVVVLDPVESSSARARQRSTLGSSRTSGSGAGADSGGAAATPSASPPTPRGRRGTARPRPPSRDRPPTRPGQDRGGGRRSPVGSGRSGERRGGDDAPGLPGPRAGDGRRPPACRRWSRGIASSATPTMATSRTTTSISSPHIVPAIWRPSSSRAIPSVLLWPCARSGGRAFRRLSVGRSRATRRAQLTPRAAAPR